jgi:hypothetical protein
MLIWSICDIGLTWMEDIEFARPDGMAQLRTGR